MSAHLRPAMLQIFDMHGEIELLRAIGLHEEAERHASRMRDLIEAVSLEMSVASTPVARADDAGVHSVA